MTIRKRGNKVGYEANGNDNAAKHHSDAWRQPLTPSREKGKGMLILSRYIGEQIYVGDDVVITVADIRGDRVRIGIDAPSNVPVHRKEVYEAIKAAHNPVAKAVASGNSVTNVRSIATPTIVARREVVPMT